MGLASWALVIGKNLKKGGSIKPVLITGLALLLALKVGKVNLKYYMLFFH